MASNSIKRDQHVLDPMFLIPDGMDEFVYDENEDTGGSDDDLEDDTTIAATESGVVDDFEVVDEGDEGYNGGGVETPEILGIVSQTIRTKDDGSQVVDVIVEVEDIPGVSKYEVRVAKV